MIKVNLNKIDIISFDIFDTLIRRNVSKPSDIFNIVELFYNKKHNSIIKDFKEIRIIAECKARKNKKPGIEDITLDEIYECMLDKFDCDTCEKLKEIEIETEINFSCGNKEMIDLFNTCKNNKKTIITSDMYLPKEVIEKILKKNGIYGYEKLYLSSELKKTKASGSLFNYILIDWGIKPKRILHIGDNKKSDFLMPMKKGLSVKLYMNNHKKINDNLMDNVINQTISNNKTDDYYYNFGFGNFGPLLIGFCNWLNKESKKYNIDKLFFLSRDGKIMKEAYDILFEGETHYLYASRRALIVPALWKAKSYEEMFSSMNIPKNIQLSHLLERIGLHFDDNKEILKYNLDLKKEYLYEDLLKNDNFKKFIRDYKSKIIENSKKEFNSFLQYIKNENFDGKLAIVDIGWFGSMQKALEKMLDKNIIGLYLGIHTRKKTQTNRMHGFLFENNKNIDLDNDEYLINSIVEFIFSTFHGSVKRFNENSEVDLYDYEYENKIEREYLEEIQKGAIDFVKKIKSLNLNNIFVWDELQASKRLFDTCLKPSYTDSKMLGKINILDNGITMIGTDKNLLYYLFRPICFVRNLKKATWKIGFLKRVFVIPINYYKWIKSLKERNNYKIKY